MFGLISMEEDELWKELMEVLTNNNCLVLLSFMRSKLLVITHEEDMNCENVLLYGWKLLESIIFQNHEEG